MQELVGRLTALDADATETLKVIAYFDALIDGHANADVLLRGAAILSGCGAGFVTEDRSVRVDASGARRAQSSSQRVPTDALSASASASEREIEWPSHRFGDNGTVWLEREGAAHANDEMILERLAIALSVAVERTSPSAARRRSLAVLIDQDSSPESRDAAAKKLRLGDDARHHVIVAPASAQLPGLSIVTETPFGRVRVAIGLPDESQPLDRAGIGLEVAPGELHRSWTSALTALRLTSARTRVIDANQLGALLVLADAATASQQTNPDTEAVAALLLSQPAAEPLLEATAEADSFRAVASGLGLHHSTVQAKVAALTDALGYDIHSPRGRTRLTLALALHRLTSNTFD